MKEAQRRWEGASCDVGGRPEGKSRAELMSLRAMILEAPGKPLRVAEVANPEPGPEQVLLRVHACAVCRTDLHVVDGAPYGNR